MTERIVLEGTDTEGRAFKHYDLVACAFVAVFLISQVASAKLFSIREFQFPGAIIVFPFAYIFGDILTECYGFARTRRIIWIGFFSAVLMSIVLWAIQNLPPAPYWPHQAAYESILGFVPRVVLGSVLAYFAGEFVNSYVMAKMKVRTGGRYLWARTIGSTVVGQGVDTAVFVSIVFVGSMPAPVLLKVVGSVYVFKVLYEIAATPLTYIVVGWIKKAEGIEVFDKKTNFTPFKI